MKVSDLIKYLQNLPQNADIIFDDGQALMQEHLSVESSEGEVYDPNVHKFAWLVIATNN